MNFVLVPFVLGAWVSTKDWKHGPEYKFGLEINMVTDMEIDNGTLLGTRLAGNLKCRPHLEDTTSLICRTENIKIIRIHPGGFHISGIELYKNETFSAFGVGRDNFQIKFNKEGIESYILEESKRSTNTFVTDMIRLMSNQLSIGADLEKQRYENNFKKMENFTVGECETEFSISRQPVLESESRRKMKYKLVSVFPNKQFNFSEDEKLVIEKKRNVDNCLRRKEYFFGTRYTYGIVLRDVYNDLKSSVSQMVISKNNFTSETINECEIFDLERNRLGKILDHMKLTLDDVQPATDELLPISKPTNFDILAGESVDISVNHYKD